MLRALLVLAVVATGCATRPRQSCPIPGELIQWQADLCLFETETDDIIAAQPCMDRELTGRTDDDCAQKKRYKLALCRLFVERGVRPGSVDECFNDPAFSGPTVRRGCL